MNILALSQRPRMRGASSGGDMVLLQTHPTSALEVFLSGDLASCP